MIQGKNFINGEFIEAKGETFDKRNPANTDELLGSFPQAGQKDIERAVEAARLAYPQWRALSRIRRGEYIDNLVQVLKREKENLSTLLSREQGKSITEARAEVTEGIHMLQYVSGLSRMPFGDVVSSEIAEKDSFMRRKPKGVIGVITPWNFPFAIPLWLIGPSLLEGNTVVFKPSKETPCVAQKLIEALREVEIPPGVLNMLHGSGERVGMPIVRHPKVVVLLFTGSAEVGQQIRKVSAELPDRMCACEMGGKNAIIILDDADMELAVNASVISAFKTSGQRCTAASRLIVHNKVVKEFQKRLVETTKRIRIGNPLNPDNFTGPVINEAQMKKILQYNELARKEGAEVLLDGGRLKGAEYDKGYFLSPYIYRMKPNPKSIVLKEEVFGPHVAIVPVK
ncbi:MAG: aldehyde dehydrogenase family protein, partial [Candidatus Brocadiales bacterium]